MEKHIICHPPYSDYLVPFSVDSVEYLVKEKRVKLFRMDEDEEDQMFLVQASKNFRCQEMVLVD